MKVFIILSYNLLICIVATAFNTTEIKNCSSIEYQFKYRELNKKLILYYNEFESMSLYNKIGFDNNETEQTSFVENSDSISIRLSNYDFWGEMIYRNFQQDSIKIRIPNQYVFDPLCIVDNWEMIEWNPINDTTKIILNYKCSLAIGYYRGRNYYAWYTNEIPYPIGPWKLFGLNGAILEAEDDSKMFYFVAKKIENINYENITFIVEDKIMNIKEYSTFLDNYHIELANKLNTKAQASSYGITIENAKSDYTIQELRERNIEKKYEWE